MVFLLMNEIKKQKLSVLCLFIIYSVLPVVFFRLNEVTIVAWEKAFNACCVLRNAAQLDEEQNANSQDNPVSHANREHCENEKPDGGDGQIRRLIQMPFTRG